MHLIGNGRKTHKCGHKTYQCSQMKPSPQLIIQMNSEDCPKCKLQKLTGEILED